MIGKDDLAALQRGGVHRHVGRTPGRPRQLHRRLAGEERRQVGHPQLGLVPPIGAVVAGRPHRLLDPERLLRPRRPAQQQIGVVLVEPVVAEHADVDVDAKGGQRQAHRVGAVLQDVGHRLAPAVRHLLVPGVPGRSEPGAHLEQRVDGAGVVQIVGGDARGVAGAGRLDQQVVGVEGVLAEVQQPGEERALLEIDVAEQARDVLPARPRRIGRRVLRVEGDVAEAAAQAHQIRRLVAVGVTLARRGRRIAALPGAGPATGRRPEGSGRVPGSRPVVGVVEQPHAENARGAPHPALGRRRIAGDAVEAQTVRVDAAAARGIALRRPGGGIVDQAEPREALVAVQQVVVEQPQQVQLAGAALGEVAPGELVAAGPVEPGVQAEPLVVGEPRKLQQVRMGPQLRETRRAERRVLPPVPIPRLPGGRILGLGGAAQALQVGNAAIEPGLRPDAGRRHRATRAATAEQPGRQRQPREHGRRDAQTSGARGAPEGYRGDEGAKIHSLPTLRSGRATPALTNKPGPRHDRASWPFAGDSQRSHADSGRRDSTVSQGEVKRSVNCPRQLPPAASSHSSARCVVCR